jgi:anti-sigma B factor antagonist
VTAAHLTVQETRTADDAVLVLTGEIDMATVGDLRAATERSMQTPPSRVVLDFAGVTFCDSQGLSALIGLNRDISAAGSRLVFINVGDFMGRLLDITGLRAAFDVVDPA